MKQPPGALRRLRDAAIVGVASAAATVLPQLPLAAVQRAGLGIGAALALLPGRRRRRLQQHLLIAFPPEQGFDDAFRARLLRTSYQSLAQMFLEAVWAPGWRDEVHDACVRLANPEAWERTRAVAKERGRGLIVYTAHLGSVEVFSRWFCSHIGTPVAAIAAPPKIQALVEPMLRVREAHGMKILFRGDAGTGAIRHLKAGGTLIILADHNLKGPGVEVNFFGRPAHTILAPARLALQTGATFTTMFGLRDGPGRFLAEVDEPVAPPPLGPKEQRLHQEAELTRFYTERIVAAIRRHPDQYLWMHKRWEKRSSTLPWPPSP